MGIVTQSEPFGVVVVSIDMRNGMSKLRTDEGQEFPDFWLPSAFGGDFAPYPKEGERLTVRERGGKIVEAYYPRYEAPKASLL